MHKLEFFSFTTQRLLTSGRQLAITIVVLEGYWWTDDRLIWQEIERHLVRQKAKTRQVNLTFFSYLGTPCFGSVVSLFPSCLPVLAADLEDGGTRCTPLITCTFSRMSRSSLLLLVSVKKVSLSPVFRFLCDLLQSTSWLVLCDDWHGIPCSVPPAQFSSSSWDKTKKIFVRWRSRWTQDRDWQVGWLQINILSIFLETFS